MTTAPMIGNRKNRGRHGDVQCSYGCCRTCAPTGANKRRTNRIIRRREKNAWAKEGA